MAPAADAVEGMLEQRNHTHGDFRDNAHHSQLLKTYFKTIAGDRLTEIQAEALDMIALKLSRILSNPHVQDHWDDIAGYARLASKELAGR